MASSGSTSNKKKRGTKRKPRNTGERETPRPVAPDPELIPPDGGDLIALIQKTRNRAAPALVVTDAEIAWDHFWKQLEEMRECSRTGLIEFDRDEKYFLFRIANKDNCGMDIMARKIEELYKFRKVFDIYWKSVKRNRKFQTAAQIGKILWGES